MLDDEAREGEAHDGGDVGHGAVDLRLRATPLMLVEVGACAGGDIFRTEARRCATALHLPFVGEHLGTPHTSEFATRETVKVAHPPTEGGRQGTAVDLPELGDPNLGGVHFQRRSHRTEEDGVTPITSQRLVGGTDYELELVAEAVDGIDYVVVLL